MKRFITTIIIVLFVNTIGIRANGIM